MAPLIKSLIDNALEALDFLGQGLLATLNMSQDLLSTAYDPTLPMLLMLVVICVVYGMKLFAIWERHR